MKQKIEVYIELIKKMLSGCLSPADKEKLNGNSFVGRAIETQWENTAEEYMDDIKQKRILNQILLRIRNEKPDRYRNLLNRYALVASLALLLICGTLSILMVTHSPNPEICFVMNSGRQSMDSVRLPDGTFVMMNAGSRLIYPSKFTGKAREVTLSGQAFFNVKSDKRHPFIVKTKTMNVTALGTAFEVFSFEGDKSMETILLSGKVKVEPKDDSENIRGTYILHPNQKLTYNEGTVEIEQVDANSYSAWRIGGRLSFKNEKLSMILPRLEKWYGQKIQCSEEIAEHYRFTFTLRNEPLDLILNIMSHSAPLVYKLNNNGYVLKELR